MLLSFPVCRCISFPWTSTPRHAGASPRRTRSAAWPVLRSSPLRRLVAASLHLAALALLSAGLPEARALPPGLVVEPVATGLAFPVSMAFAPDGRVFYNELRTGKIRILQNGRPLQQPFFEFQVYNTGERGLIGLALHPDFPAQPWVYAYATMRVRQPQEHPENHLVRLRADGNVGVLAEPPLLVLPTNPQVAVHNGGRIRFGPDGKLYLTVGDAFTQGSAQNLDFLGGKVLRLEPDGSPAAGNPYASAGGNRAYVYSRGHRNSIGLAFRPGTGGLYQTENGPTEGDEINRIVAGANYGWPDCIGPCDPPDPRFVDPLRSYTPTIAPTGVAFLSAIRYAPPLAGSLVFGDFNVGRLRRLALDPANPDRVSTADEDFLELSELAPADEADLHQLGALDLQSGPDGYLWFSVVDQRLSNTVADLSGIYRLRSLQPVEAGLPPRALWAILVATALAIAVRRASVSGASGSERRERTPR